MSSGVYAVKRSRRSVAGGDVYRDHCKFHALHFGAVNCSIIASSELHPNHSYTTIIVALLAFAVQTASYARCCRCLCAGVLAT